MSATLTSLARRHRPHSALAPHTSQTASVTELKKLLSQLGDTG